MTYPSTRYLRRMTNASGWRGELICDAHGPYVIVAVRVGATWTDAVAIEGEDRCVAMRHRRTEEPRPEHWAGGPGRLWTSR